MRAATERRATREVAFRREGPLVPLRWRSLESRVKIPA
jgi:hypothetical protein